MSPPLPILVQRADATHDRYNRSHADLASKRRALGQDQVKAFLNEAPRDGNTLILLPDQTARSSDKREEMKKRMKRKVEALEHQLPQ